MELRNGGIAFTIIVVVVVAMAFGYILTSGGSSLYPTSYSHKYTADLNVWADANGWELKQGSAATHYNSSATSLVNPILYYNTSTLVYLNVTEADGAPHNFIIAYDGQNTSALYTTITGASSGISANPLKWEPLGGSYTIISVSDLTQNIGHTAQGKYPFQKAGIYTYWCSVHPNAMYGLIIIGGPAGS